jgi:ABC-type thiamine transport system ATPase subunit
VYRDLGFQRTFYANITRPGDVVIAVMGVTGSGKTTFVNYFADVEVEIGHGLEPCEYRLIAQSILVS